MCRAVTGSAAAVTTGPDRCARDRVSFRHDLEARARGLESRAQRVEEDVTAIITTVIETRDDVKWLKRAVGVLLADRDLTIGPDEDETDE
jgi:hypothetical protein